MAMRRTPHEIRIIYRGLARRGLLKRVVSICRQYSVEVDDVLGGVRSTRVVHARDACIVHVLRVPMSTTETGALFGMDHTSIVAARQRYKTRDNGRLLT